MKPQQMERGRRDEHADLVGQRQRIEQQRRRAVPSWVRQLVPGLTTGALRQPADLPEEQASQFEVLVNMRTARILGLTVPASVLVRADRGLE
jgi:hypothetical protein